MGKKWTWKREARKIFYLCSLSLCHLCAAEGVAGPVPNHTLQQLQENINQAVAVARPSVVNVTAQKHSGTQLKQDALWYESIGSGFVIDQRGYILTNYHVVNDARRIDVSLWHDQTNRFPAQIVHADRELDLVVLKIDTGTPLTPVAFGNSDRVKVGDWVLSVGNPFGFNHSVTLGTVSAQHRDLVIGGKSYKDMIQTDAVINEGNSGGPIVDMYGHVVGVGTAIYAPDGTYTGLGFAIPINRAKHFFTWVTGAVTAALQTPATAPSEKSRINMNETPPHDLTHQEFNDCTTCHIITKKSVVSATVQMTHPMVGACDKCHIMEKGTATGIPVTVAAVRPLNEIGTQVVDFWGYSKDSLFKCVLLILVASILFSMIGVGGGFFYVPILLYCGINFYTASTTSLLMIATNLSSAVVVFARAGYVDWKLVIVLEIPTVIGAFIGGVISNYFDTSQLYWLFSLMLFAASYYMLQDTTQLTFKKHFFKTDLFTWYHEFKGEMYEINLLLALPITLCAGFIGGLLGVAGGWIKVPLMVVLLSIPVRIAVACSSVMVPITGLSGFLGHQVVGHFEPSVAIPLAIISLIGAEIGARFSLQTATGLLRMVFAFIMSVIALLMLLKLL